jgi:formylglycine-generating enzyme required for sulfatase activity
MTQYFIYIIEVSICLALFYIVYTLFASGDTFHNLKRFYLLISVVVSILIPQLPSNQMTLKIEKTIVRGYTTKTDYSNYGDTFEKVVFGNVPNIFVSQNSPTRFPFIFILSIIYLIGSIYLLYKLFYNLLIIRKLITVYEKEKHGDYYIVNLTNSYSSFTFFNYIFFNSNNLNTEDKKDVLLHELEHFRQRHSVDIIFIEIIKIFLWFNPVIWLVKKSLVKTHECLADTSVIKNKLDHSDDYQSLLLKQYLSNINIELAHPFNYSLIKFRIKMMTKKESKWWAKYKLFFAFPVLIIGLVAFTNYDMIPNITGESENINENSNSEPQGMVFIPQGNFTLKRTNGNSIKEFNVSIDPFWMKETEVSVREYVEFLESLKKDSSKSVYKSAMPNEDKAPFENYFSNEEYLDFPVVGVNLKQAKNFCDWKTRVENQKLESQGKNVANGYRIPTDVEWIYASFGGMDPNQIEKPKTSALTKIGSKKPNGWGLLNMFDNVSEWTYTAFEPDKYMKELLNYPETFDEEIIVVGNNYKNSLDTDKTILNGGDSYNYVGFRYVRTYKVTE